MAAVVGVAGGDLAGVDAHRVTLPEARADGFGEVALRHEVALVVDRRCGSWGSGRAAGPKITLPLSARSKVDWWHGQSRWWVCCSYRRDRAADVGADLGVAEDAVDDPVLAARAGGDVVGLHPDQDDRGLGLGDLERRRPRCRRLAVRRPRAKIAAGSALTRSPISRSDGLIGVPTTSRTTRMPWLPDRVRRACRPGSGPRSRSITIGGQAEQAERAEQRVADQRAAADAGLLDAGCSTSRRSSSRSSSRRTAGVAASRRSRRRPSACGPTGSGRCRCSSSARPRAAAERQVGGAEAADGVRVVADLEGEVGDEEARTAQTSRQPEQRRDLALGALLRPAGRRRSGATGAPGRPGLAIGSLAGSSRDSPGAWSSWPLTLRPSSCVERVVWAAIQTAKPTQAPMPTSQANRPSVTGPRPPRPKPPYVGLVLAATGGRR